MVLCFSESSLNFEANHQGKYDGICGVNPIYWNEYLADQGFEYNSLKGGVEVYKFYLDKYDNKKTALLKYKGANTNVKVKKIVDKIIRLEKEFKPKLNKLENLK